MRIIRRTATRELTGLALAPHFLVQDRKLLQLGEWMLGELRSGGASGRLYRDALAYMTAVHMLQRYTSRSGKCVKLSGVPNRHIALVIEYMHEHLEQDMSLHELAAVANVSPSHLVRLFKRQTGAAPHQYVIRLRIERAKILLRHGGLGVKEIAVQIGFADQGHFTRMFKRATGMTPAQYRGR